VSGAFEKPALKQLDRKFAPFILAVFKSSFSRHQQSIQAARLHAPSRGLESVWVALDRNEM